MRRIHIYSKYIVFFIAAILIVPTFTSSAATATGVNFSVAPSQSIIVKPNGSDAQGGLDIRLTPEGKATNANRTPIDVVFVFDKSGSMNGEGKDDGKLPSAKNAMAEAVNYFSADPNKSDRFAFIPFANHVETENIVPFPKEETPTVSTVQKNLKLINSTIQGIKANESTNYTESFQEAASMLTSSNNNSQKYIILLTDGQSNVAVHNGQSTETELKPEFQKEVDKLAANNIKLYSVYFGNKNDVDMGYLQKMSETTGATAQQASTDAIPKILEDILQKMATSTISATVKINISDFGDKVKLAEGADATLDSSGNIIIKKDLLFPINQDMPGSIDVSLPLLFSSKGTYNFDQITLQYRNLDGVMQEKTTQTSITVEEDATATAPHIDFTVTPSQNVIVKPSGSDAQGSLDIRLTPKGKATNANRAPIDVAFVFDKSGSMDELGKDPGKFLSAKHALAEAVNYFSADPNKLDRFAFIPFSDDVESDSMIGFPVEATPPIGTVQTNLKNINLKAQGLYANGFTNYTQSFQRAASILTSSNTNSKKYIFFLTDGQPTVSSANEKIGNNYKNVTYINYINYYGVKKYNNEIKYISVNDAVANIKSHIQTEVNNLADNNIKLYSIGFGSKNDVDMGYLQKMSEITGVTAQQASTDTIAKIFEDISQKIATPAITATVKINISKFGGKVKLADGANATTDSIGNIMVKKDILFPINQDSTGTIDVSLPLTFNSTGTYDFDNITLQYRDLDGVLQEKTASTTITVKDDAPASFNNSMTLEKEVNELNNLVKTSNSTDKTNYFNVNYALKPTNLVSNTVSGQLKNLVIEQPIPDGVSIIQSTNVVEQIKDGKRYAVITLANNIINYSNGSFSPAEVTASIKCKVDYAVYNLTMPKANLKFTDTRFSGSNETSIPASSQAINMKVLLKEKNINKYEGDAAGIIEKRDIATNNKLVQTEMPNDYNLANKAIKDMEYKSGSNNQVIEITYYDDSKAYLYLVPDYDLIGKFTGNKYNSGDTTTESIDMKLSNKVAGSDVKYYYQIKNGNQTGNWTEFAPTDVISIMKTGLNEIKVKAVGGFANNVEVPKNITIQKIVQSITVQPNPINLTVGSTGNFTVTVEPTDATNNKLDISIADPTIASIVPEQNTLAANKAGTTELIVRSTEGSNLEVRVHVTVIDPYIALEKIKFSKPVYEITQSDDTITNYIAVKDLLTFIPSNATEKDLENVISNMPNRIEVVKIDGEYYLKGKELGFATVTATSEKQKNGSLPKDSTLFEVVKRSSGSAGNDGDGRW
ncbi:vWA domain-containing protein [Niallia sp. 03133]|uniref:vWA domain-containing protein n=1 Tax=Niallia sp. 03133 TaxID=3458060 RepID=UPI004043FCF5